MGTLNATSPNRFQLFCGSFRVGGMILTRRHARHMVSPSRPLMWPHSVLLHAVLHAMGVVVHVTPRLLSPAGVSCESETSARTVLVRHPLMVHPLLVHPLLVHLLLPL